MSVYRSEQRKIPQCGGNGYRAGQPLPAAHAMKMVSTTTGYCDKYSQSLTTVWSHFQSAMAEGSCPWSTRTQTMNAETPCSQLKFCCVAMSFWPCWQTTKVAFHPQPPLFPICLLRPSVHSGRRYRLACRPLCLAVELTSGSRRSLNSGHT
jgi:hypothetical protein